ncbi:uncharacterized protein F5891DRAFT_1180202 [Suillus fuscotomentosus]|uniref:Uncharacterized protein n=1 Tax=Suillus fuscotomentosus TaxID=1912939 RepID=A0AAD4HU79_9AGAM|nr:uncharacterized protein F5891DRAFT_1180202 [Suillus fuscotomentosus]KAG1908667.1 hypothetical protein F5891DRAFT_1180202 [Suillus fuscotomentosus]
MRIASVISHTPLSIVGRYHSLALHVAFARSSSRALPGLTNSNPLGPTNISLTEDYLSYLIPPIFTHFPFLFYSGTLKETYYSQLANAIFSNDEDPEVRRLFQTKPGALIKPVQTRFGTLKRKYNEFNKSLKQTGAGLTYDELQKNPQTKTLIDLQLNKFPWWLDLHGWWRTNPAYNTVFSTADLGQNHESAALQHFRMPDCEDTQLPANENEPKEDADIEDGEIIDMGDIDTNVDACQEDINPIDTTDANAAGQVDDDIEMEQSDWFIHVQQAPTFPGSSSSTLGFFHGSTSTGSYTSLPHLRPSIAPISTCYFDQDAISLNSPEPPPDDQSDSQYSFFSSFKEPTSNHNTTPHDSDSDISASNAMNRLWVDSRKVSPCRGHPGSQIMKLSGGTTRSTSPQSPQATLSRPPSRKRANNNQALTTAAAEWLSETAQVLIQQVGEKRDGRVKHDCYKRMKLESDMWAKELKVRNAHDEREHTLRLAEQDHLHKRELMGHQLEDARLELELACARREEEARIWHIAMERGLPDQV